MGNLVINGKVLTPEEEEIIHLKHAISLTEMTMDGGRHCDTKLYQKAVKGYKKRIEELTKILGDKYVSETN